MFDCRCAAAYDGGITVPGQPKKQAMIAEIERRKEAEYEDEAHKMSNLEYVARYVEGGGTLRKLAREVLSAIGSDLQLSALDNYLYRTWDDEAGTRLAIARRRGAQAHAEEALDIADDASTTDREHLKKADMQVSTRQWIAKSFDREQFGDATGPVVTVNVQTLHLDALRKFNVDRTQARISASEVVPDAAVEPDER